jgi:hypothetical protein
MDHCQTRTWSAFCDPALEVVFIRLPCSFLNGDRRACRQGAFARSLVRRIVRGPFVMTRRREHALEALVKRCGLSVRCSQSILLRC